MIVENRFNEAHGGLIVPQKYDHPELQPCYVEFVAQVEQKRGCRAPETFTVERADRVDDQPAWRIELTQANGDRVPVLFYFEGQPSMAVGTWWIQLLGEGCGPDANHK